MMNLTSNVIAQSFVSLPSIDWPVLALIVGIAIIAAVFWYRNRKIDAERILVISGGVLAILGGVSGALYAIGITILPLSQTEFGAIVAVAGILLVYHGANLIYGIFKNVKSKKTSSKKRKQTNR